MDERNDADKLDEVMLPGFRFHPTDEELVGFYLKRKIQQRPLTIELIKQLDIYKYDPWDLPKMATTGEKEWYFYCPRDRKYRNSARPNRVTEAGFWKATGTDRPIYSSEGSKCIGLKKSLVFYKGRAAKGIKTDWMMHEFRLPSIADPAPTKRYMDKTIPANDAWAICRIFKKNNTTAQRALSHSWVSVTSLPEPTIPSDMLVKGSNTTHFISENLPLTSTEPSSAIQLNYTSEIQSLNFSSYKPYQLPISNVGDLTGNNFLFSSSLETSGPALLNLPPSTYNGDICKVATESIAFETGSQEPCSSSFSMTSLPQVMQLNVSNGDHENASVKCLQNDDHHQWETPSIIRSMGFPFSLPMNVGDAWKPSLLWESSSSCPSDIIASSFSTAKCYT